MKEWRRVCTSTPLRASIRMTARSRVRGAGRHVAGVLLMAGRVGDDEGASRRGEEAIGDVDGDALLALGLEPVHQQREIDVVAGGAVPGAESRCQRRQLILEDQLAVVQQPADQGRLAVIDRAAGEKAQQVLAFGRAESGGLYASIRNSPPASSSPSRRLRRCRSAGPVAPKRVAVCISATMSSMRRRPRTRWRPLSG